MTAWYSQKGAGADKNSDGSRMQSEVGLGVRESEDRASDVESFFLKGYPATQGLLRCLSRNVAPCKGIKNEIAFISKELNEE